ncbi:MAG TPA: MopE-related protein [Polyangiaceae bacterium]
MLTASGLTSFRMFRNVPRPVRSLVWAALPWLACACSQSSVPSPFAYDDAGVDAALRDATTSDLSLDVGSVEDPTLGGPCNDDAQCDDQLDCTIDSCDLTLSRCRNRPNDALCDDGVYCNGSEVCEPRLGCRAGDPTSCSDQNSCTIDTCVESDHSCLHQPRDADGDGDPVWNCVDGGGGDCDDTDPLVSSKALEVCGNGKDDNCNGQIDEADCTKPAHDTCADPLLIAASGASTLSLVATALDYPTSCAASTSYHDAVVALSVPAGDAQDVDVVALANASVLALGTAKTCGDAASAQCVSSFPLPGGGSVARMEFYGLTPGNYPLYVASNAATTVSLNVTFGPASSPPSNETCQTAATLVPSQSTLASLASASVDVQSACASSTGDLVYTFTLDQASDVRLYANPLDDQAATLVSLRNADCKKASDELTCRSATPAALFARALPAGQYFVSVAASEPTDVELRLELSAASVAPADEGCAAPPTLAPAVSVAIDLSDHTDAVTTGCLVGAPDSSHLLTLEVSSDVLLVERISDFDSGAVSLFGSDCSEKSRIACDSSQNSPVRARAYGLSPGTYRAVAESQIGNPVTLSALTRTSAPPVFVAFADSCAAPFEMPQTGGRFQGSTASANADFEAGCDVGGQASGGAPDQIFHLALTQKSRVVLDMAGSDYSTLLSVRSGQDCPGLELPLACAAGYVQDRSFLDLTLDPGNYFVLVDGYDGAAGAWQLDAYIAPI